jgi:hypothetical protein
MSSEDATMAAATPTTTRLMAERMAEDIPIPVYEMITT